MPSNEELRVAWVDSVATANQLADLAQRAREAGDDDELILELESNAQDASDAVDVAYKAYLQATANWVTEAPWRFDAIVVSSTVQSEDGETVVPSITFGFRARNVEPITVTLILEELALRKFQATLGKEIDKAVRSVRELKRGN